MDRTPLDSQDQDDLTRDGYPGAFAPPPAADPGEGQARTPEAPTSPDAETAPTDRAVPTDWQDRLDAAQRRADEAERREREYQQALQDRRRADDEVLRTTIANQKQLFRQRIREGTLSPEQIEEGWAYFESLAETRARQAEEARQRVEHRDAVHAFIHEDVAQRHRLTPDEVKKLERYDFSHNPSLYDQLAADIAAQRDERSAINERLARLEREHDAQAVIDSRAHLVGGGGQPALAGANGQRPEPGSEDEYLSIPWQRRY